MFNNNKIFEFLRDSVSRFDDLIRLPESIASTMTMQQLINITFPNLKTLEGLSDRVIVTPKNATVDEINTIATQNMPGLPITCKSYDRLIKDSQQANLQTEFLNTLNLSGMPPHNLQLKVGMPIILMRNVNPCAGLCNGTRLIIKKVLRRVIEAEISVGELKGKTVFIPRMNLIPTDTELPFDFQRLQFPIRPAFCMSINKSQGQTLESVSIWLGDEHVFTHGQLYGALSRVSGIENIKIATNNPNLLTRNEVFHEIFNEQIIQKRNL